MQLITHQNHINRLPPSSLKTYIQARFNQLSEDSDFEIPPIFVLVESGDNITGSDFAFIGSSSGLLEGYFEDHPPHHPNYARNFEWASHNSTLKLYEAVNLQFVDFGYWILLPESIVEQHIDLKYVLTAPALGGLSDAPALN